MRAMHAVPAELIARAAVQCGLVSSRDCDELGVTAARRGALVEHGIWRRLTTGVYDTCPEPTAPRLGDERARRAAWLGLLAYGPDAVAVGRSALAMLKIGGLPQPPVSEIAVTGGRSVRSRDGIALRQFDAGMRVIEVAGRWVAAPEWAMAQAVPELGRNHAIAVMDSALHLGLLDPAGLEHAHDLARGRRGVERTHDWWTMADGRAESPLETHGRLDCHDVGMPPDDLQVRVYDDVGILLGRGDTGWRQPSGRWLVGELDGRAPHELPQALLHDRNRQNDFLVSGAADILRFTWRDIGPHHRMGRTVLRFLANVGRLPLPR